MDTQQNPIQLACNAVGSAAQLARLIDVKPPTISQWDKGFDEVTGKLRDLAMLRPASPWRPVPEKRCPAIEWATEGKVTVESLRPDISWVRVPDAAWPNSAGRPCIDVIGPAEELRHAA